MTGVPGWIRRAPLAATALIVLVAGPAAADDLRLVDAMKRQDVAAVRALLQERADPNAAAGDGATALHWAAHWNDIDAAGLLLAAGANPGAANDNAITPLALACTNGSVAMAERLLRGGADPNAATLTGRTVLMMAAESGSAALVQMLLAHGAAIEAKETLKGQTALMWAASEGHAAVVRTLIEKGADVRARSNSGFTPLLFAARQGDADTVKLLIAAGVGINDVSVLSDTGPQPRRAPRRKTPPSADALSVAIASDQDALVDVLLDLGADPDARGMGFSPLHYAVHMRNAAQVRTLLGRGANPNARMTTDVPRRGNPGMPMAGATPFLIAAKSGDIELMRLLLANGADPRMATDNGTTPLMAAAGVGWVEGQDRRRESERTTPLDPAADEAAALEAVRLTLELGGDVAAANAAGDTALHGAAHMGANSVVDLLVARGAPIDARNKFGQTPWRLAEGFYVGGAFVSHKETASLLVKLGADPAQGGPSFTTIGR